jgi:hypothetical protein
VADLIAALTNGNGSTPALPSDADSDPIAIMNPRWQTTEGHTGRPAEGIHSDSESMSQATERRPLGSWMLTGFQRKHKQPPQKPRSLVFEFRMTSPRLDSRNNELSLKTCVSCPPVVPGRCSVAPETPRLGVCFLLISLQSSLCVSCLGMGGSLRTYLLQFCMTDEIQEEQPDSSHDLFDSCSHCSFATPFVVKGL